MTSLLCFQRPEDIEDDSDVEYVEYEDEYEKCKLRHVPVIILLLCCALVHFQRSLHSVPLYDCISDIHQIRYSCQFACCVHVFISFVYVTDSREYDQSYYDSSTWNVSICQFF